MEYKSFWTNQPHDYRSRQNGSCSSSGVEGVEVEVERRLPSIIQDPELFYMYKFYPIWKSKMSQKNTAIRTEETKNSFISGSVVCSRLHERGFNFWFQVLNDRKF